MKREKMIDKLISQSLKILENDKTYSKEAELKIWGECCDWNSEHSDDEIFMCEYSGHYSTTQVIGYMIEDDIFIYPEYKEAFNEGTMKQNNEHIVMSIAKTKGGIELQEDLQGTLPELTSLLVLYIVHFCQHLAKKELTEDGHKFNPKTILMGIIIAAKNNIDDELDMEDVDE